MSLSERPTHNPHRLPCPIENCCRRFRNQSGLTNHIRTSHPDSQQPQRPEDSDSESKHRHSSPINLNANEAENTLPVHRPDETSSQGNQDITPPPSQFLPEINQPTFDSSTGSSLHGSPREASPASGPEGDAPNQPILKIFHPVINGPCMS